MDVRGWNAMEAFSMSVCCVLMEERGWDAIEAFSWFCVSGAEGLVVGY